jgi:hypothetical protein
MLETHKDRGNLYIHHNFNQSLKFKIGIIEEKKVRELPLSGKDHVKIVVLWVIIKNVFLLTILECTERPRKIGARFTNTNIAADDIVQNLKFNW